MDIGGREPCRDGKSGCGEPFHPCGRPGGRLLAEVRDRYPARGSIEPFRVSSVDWNLQLTAKNRVHLDVRVAGREVRGEARKRLVSEHVERLVQAGASLAWRTDDVRGSSVTLYDPEGNEFCVT